MKDISIYVHIPFCSSKCYYCSFCSFYKPKEEHERYFKAVINEIKCKSQRFKNYFVKTIYFGGGTPSVVDEKYIYQLIKTVKNYFLVDENIELTVELNPNSTTKSKLEYFKKIGVNRLSFGVQTFNKKSLNYVGRVTEKNSLKTYKQNVFNLLKYSKNLGFKNVSADFILGIPFQKSLQVKNFIKKVSKDVVHFSCYMLQLEEGTKLKEIQKNDLDENIVLNQYNTAVKILKKLGFNQYEISNFSKIGFESKHNLCYWKRLNYLGFGLAAHSFYNNCRFYNTEDFITYCDYWNKTKNLCYKELKENNIIFFEKLTKKECSDETIMLSLRTSQGLNLREFKEKFFNLEKYFSNKIDLYLKNGLIIIENGYLKLTDKGMLVANEIIVNFADDTIKNF